MLKVARNGHTTRFVQLPSIQFCLNRSTLNEGNISGFPNCFGITNMRNGNCRLHVMNHAIIINLTKFFLSLQTNRCPIRRLTRPYLRLLKVFNHGELQLLRRLRNVRRLCGKMAVRRTMTATFTTIISKCRLHVLRIKVRTYVLIRRPCTSGLHYLLNVLLFSTRMPNRYRHNSTTNNYSRTITIRLIRFKIQFTITTRMERSIKLYKIQPVVTNLTRMIILITANERLLFRRRKGELCVR